MNTLKQVLIKKIIIGWAMLLSIACVSVLKAQTDIKQALKSGGYTDNQIKGKAAFEIPVDGKRYKASWLFNDYYDLVLPKSISYPYLYVKVRGGDGSWYWNANVSRKGGGEGATVWATFKIGEDANEITPGSTLRFIIGEKGDKDNASRGGGGTGLAYKNPKTGKWIILAVAGGGGGAGTGTKGVPGQITEYGRPGRGYDGNGGSNGSDGKNYKGSGDAGLGYLSAVKNGEPVGSHGSTSWGFGGGGKPDIVSIDNNGGGGGGGYSGGGGGRRPFQGGGGGGGGSYINPDYAIDNLKIVNGSTFDPQNGYVEFQFTNIGRSNEIQLAANTNQCLDVESGKTANETNVQLYDCKGGHTQQWVIDGLQIRLGKDTKKCLDADYHDPATNSNANIQLYDCNGGANQQFIYDGFSGAFRLGVAPWKCIRPAGGSTDSRTNIEIYGCTGGGKQHWNVPGAAALVDKSGVKTIHLAAATNKCLDVYNANTANKTNVQLYDCHGGSRSPQQFVFSGAQIKLNKDQNKCLDITSGNTGNGTNIQLYDCLDKINQSWIYDGLTQVIRSQLNPEKCLQVKNSATANETNVELYDCNGSSAQQWVIE